jgi:hypothetical protein
MSHKHYVIRRKSDGLFMENLLIYGPLMRAYVYNKPKVGKGEEPLTDDEEWIEVEIKIKRIFDDIAVPEQ